VHSESSDARSSRSSSPWLALAIAILLGGYLLVTSIVTLSETRWTYDVKRMLELGLLPLIFITVLLDGSLRAGLQEQMRRLCMAIDAIYPLWHSEPYEVGAGVLRQTGVA
jgi:hypothetical protein